MLEVSVKLKGGLFTGGIPRRVERIIIDETLTKISTRLQRKGKGIGEQRNTTTLNRDGLKVSMASTLKSPRTTGSSKRSKSIAITKSMAPRVMNATAKKIAEEMS